MTRFNINRLGTFVAVVAIAMMALGGAAMADEGKEGKADPAEGANPCAPKNPCEPKNPCADKPSADKPSADKPSADKPSKGY